MTHEETSTERQDVIAYMQRNYGNRTLELTKEGTMSVPCLLQALSEGLIDDFNQLDGDACRLPVLDHRPEGTEASWSRRSRQRPSSCIRNRDIDQSQDGKCETYRN